MALTSRLIGGKNRERPWAERRLNARSRNPTQTEGCASIPEGILEIITKPGTMEHLLYNLGVCTEVVLYTWKVVEMGVVFLGSCNLGGCKNGVVVNVDVIKKGVYKCLFSQKGVDKKGSCGSEVYT